MARTLNSPEEGAEDEMKRDITKTIDRMMGTLDDPEMRRVLEHVKRDLNYTAPEDQWRKLTSAFNRAFDPSNPQHHDAGKVLAGQ